MELDLMNIAAVSSKSIYFFSSSKTLILFLLTFFSICQKQKVVFLRNFKRIAPFTRAIFRAKQMLIFLFNEYLWQPKVIYLTSTKTTFHRNTNRAEERVIAHIINSLRFKPKRDYNAKKFFSLKKMMDKCSIMHVFWR